MELVPGAGEKPWAHLLKIPHSQDTRWSSTFMMLQRVYTTWKALLQYAVGSLDPYPVELTASTFEHISNLVDILVPVMVFNAAI